MSAALNIFICLPIFCSARCGRKWPISFATLKKRGLTTSLDTNDDPDEEWSEDLLRCSNMWMFCFPTSARPAKYRVHEDVKAPRKFLSSRFVHSW